MVNTRVNHDDAGPVRNIAVRMRHKHRAMRRRASDDGGGQLSATMPGQAVDPWRIGYEGPVHVVFVNLWHPPVLDATRLIARDVTRRGFGAALVRRGHRVTVVQEAPWRCTVQHDGVTWEMVPPSSLTRLIRQGFAFAGHPSPHVPAPADAPGAVVEALRPDVIHSFDLAFYPSLYLLRRVADRLGVPLFAHFHGGAPARRPGYAAVARAALRGTRLLFTDSERGQAWVRAGLVHDAQIDTMVETSSFFRSRDRLAARARTGLSGDPLFLSAGRLDRVKDPRTTIDGFRRIAARLPGARFAVAWTDAPLLGEVRALAAGLPITWLGLVEHDRMADVLASADFLVQSSIREVCGVVVLEALACGTPPIVSDIPSFRALTDNGGVGALFPVGEPAGLAARALQLAMEDRPGQRARAAAWFDAALAFDPLAERLEGLYRSASGVGAARRSDLR